MIGYLEGRLRARLGDSLLVQTAGGVGYQVHVPAGLLARETSGEGAIHLHVVTLVRDEEIALYGFENPQDKALFQLLLKATGVGPKLALAMLSVHPLDVLTTAIVGQDIAVLTTVPGIGKKTALRLCVELSDRLAKAASPPATPGSPRMDLISALTNLGFPEKDVLAIVPKLPPEGGPFSDQIRQALALLGRR
ncbi:MAG: Holliday junction branch migration protein RuvA [Candidatus Lambdaproteobacteria bacterium]|nr:Holliday junction branch migration protein RuvA [Candidatus Lambdaproteobacteria bacterium]